MRNLLLSLLCLTLWVINISSVKAQQSTRVAFGCCLQHDQRQPVFDALTHSDPDVFVFLGNSLDVDADDMDDLLAEYEVFNRFRGPRLLRRQSAVMSVWGRNDYRMNGNAGRENPIKYAVRNHFLTFWREPISSPRMFQDHGIAKSVIFGNAPQRVQVIVLDGRWNRDPLPLKGWFDRLQSSFNPNQGPYLANPAGQLLGEEQWQWLRDQLQKPAEVRLLMSATPFFAPANGYDSWAMYAQEQQRLTEMLQTIQPQGLVLAVGDRKFGELSRLQDVLPYPLWQISGGSLSAPGDAPYDSQWRVDNATEESRYGQVEVLWQQQPQLTFSLRNEEGRVLQSHEVTLSQLQ